MWRFCASRRPSTVRNKESQRPNSVTSGGKGDFHPPRSTAIPQRPRHPPQAAHHSPPKAVGRALRILWWIRTNNAVDQLQWREEQLINSRRRAARAAQQRQPGQKQTSCGLSTHAPDCAISEACVLTTSPQSHQRCCVWPWR